MKLYLAALRWKHLLRNLHLVTLWDLVYLTWKPVLGTWEPLLGNLGGVGLGAAPVCSETLSMAEKTRKLLLLGKTTKNRAKKAKGPLPQKGPAVAVGVAAGVGVGLGVGIGVVVVVESRSRSCSRIRCCRSSRPSRSRSCSHIVVAVVIVELS